MKKQIPSISIPFMYPKVGVIDFAVASQPKDTKIRLGHLHDDVHSHYSSKA